MSTLFTTFFVIERKAAIADNAINILEDIRKNTNRLTCADVEYVSSKAVLLRRPDMCSVTSYASTVKNGELSADILELISIKGPVIIVMGLTLSEEDAAIRDHENINFEALTAAAVVKAMQKKKDCVFLLTSDSTDYNNSFIEAMLSKFPFIDASRFSHTVCFRSQGGFYDEGVMWARVAELLDYLRTVTR